MKPVAAAILAVLVPAHALAGAEYTAEDVIRYFEQANAAAKEPAAPAARAAPGANGIVVGHPPALGRRGAVIGAPAAAVQAATGTAPAARPQGVVAGNAPAWGEAPLVIPMTGAKSGYTEPAAAAPAASRPVAYDLLVTFELDSANLTPQARQNLDAFAQALRSPALAGLRFAVEGHTDATGASDHNMKLSEARAASVVGYLVGHGVDPGRLTAAGFGESRPRTADPDHPENRRVETRRIE